MAPLHTFRLSEAELAMENEWSDPEYDITAQIIYEHLVRREQKLDL